MLFALFRVYGFSTVTPLVHPVILGVIAPTSHFNSLKADKTHRIAHFLPHAHSPPILFDQSGAVAFEDNGTVV